MAPLHDVFYLILMIAKSHSERGGKAIVQRKKGSAPAHHAITPEEAFEYPRDFLENQFVYLVISPRARGLSIGVNLNPVTRCTFQCLYCEIDRGQPGHASRFDAGKMAVELRQTYQLAESGGLRRLPRYA